MHHLLTLKRRNYLMDKTIYSCASRLRESNRNDDILKGMSSFFYSILSHLMQQLNVYEGAQRLYPTLKRKANIKRIVH